MRLLGAIANTKSLCLSANTLNILSSARGMNLPVFPNLTRLEFHVFDDFDWNLGFDFLESSPKLEIFVLKKGPKMFGPCLEAQGWNPQQVAPPSCLVLNVKVIEITGFKRRKDDELELFKYLLENANVLETMTVDSVKLDPKDALCKNMLLRRKLNNNSN